MGKNVNATYIQVNPSLYLQDTRFSLIWRKQQAIWGQVQSKAERGFSLGKDTQVSDLMTQDDASAGSVTCGILIVGSSSLPSRWEQLLPFAPSLFSLKNLCTLPVNSMSGPSLLLLWFSNIPQVFYSILVFTIRFWGRMFVVRLDLQRF